MFFQLHPGAARAAALIDLDEARHAAALGRPEAGGQVLHHHQLRALEQRAHEAGEALLVQRHVLGQPGEHALVDAAELVEQLAQLRGQGAQLLRRVVGDRQRNVLPGVQAADQAAVRRHEADPAEQLLARGLGQLVHFGAEDHEARALARSQLADRLEQLVLAAGVKAVRAGLHDPDALGRVLARHGYVAEEGTHCSAVTKPNNATPYTMYANTTFSIITSSRASVTARMVARGTALMEWPPGCRPCQQATTAMAAPN